MTTAQHPRYHFDRWIAAGGMGEVWAATDTLLEREVAVKVLRPEYAQDEVLRARFTIEARHAASLLHPNVASVLDYGEMPQDGRPPRPFLVMELVEGQPLSALLSGGQALPPEVAADLVAQAALGVAAAHELGIVHRDVKPGNLLVTPDGKVKVTDFGVARAADAAQLTMTGHLVGTPHYLSPEQAQGEPASAASDIYALGIVLFECLTGRKPFVGESPVTTALMQIRDPLPALPAEVPDRLAEIVRMATAKQPDERFRSAAAMASALRDDAYETTTLPLPHAVPAAAPARRFPWPVLVAAIALVVLLGAVWAANQGTSVHPDTPAALTPSASPAAHATHQARHRRRHVHRTSGPKASPVSGPVRHAAPRHHHPAAHGGGHSETKKGGPHKPGKPGHAKRGHKGGKG